MGIIENTHLHFWRKRAILSFVMAIGIFMGHNRAFWYFERLPDRYNLYYKLLLLPFDAAVPFFFILSGFLLFRNFDASYSGYLIKIKSRIKSLFIPYIIWNSIYTLDALKGVSSSEVKIQDIFVGVLCFKYNSPFWYVAVLLIMVFLSPIVGGVLKNRIIGIIVIAIAIFFGPNVSAMDFPLAERFEGIIWFMLGAYIGIHFNEWFIRVEINRTPWNVVMFILFVLLSIYTFYIWTTNTTITSWQIRVIVRAMEAIALWKSFDLFMPYIKHTPLFINESFLVYASHTLIGKYVTEWLYFVMSVKIEWAFPNYFLTLIISIFTMWIVWKYMLSKVPFFNCILLGGRGRGQKYND